MNANDDDIEQLRHQVPWLNRRIYFLTEENADLRRRVVFLAQELEHAREKIPASAIRTS